MGDAENTGGTGTSRSVGGWQVDLSGAEPLRTSQNYRLYDHPKHPGVLLKVRADDDGQAIGPVRFATWRYGNLRQWNREANEYLAALHRGVPEIDRLAQFMGFANTSEGPALMVEKLTGPDGALAPTVTQLLRSMKGGDPERRELHDEFMELLDDLERSRIIVGDLYFDNVVRARERNGRLTIIDGLGERVLFPLTLFSRRAFELSMARRRERLSKSIFPNG